MDLRNPDRPAPSYVTCRTCDAHLPFERRQMWLTPTHAVLCCAACGAEVRVRRSDAHRAAHDADATIASAVAVSTIAGFDIDPGDEGIRLPRLLWGRRAQMA